MITSPKLLQTHYCLYDSRVYSLRTRRSWSTLPSPPFLKEKATKIHFLMRSWRLSSMLWGDWLPQRRAMRHSHSCQSEGCMHNINDSSSSFCTLQSKNVIGNWHQRMLKLVHFTWDTKLHEDPVTFTYSAWKSIWLDISGWLRDRGYRKVDLLNFHVACLYNILVYKHACPLSLKQLTVRLPCDESLTVMLIVLSSLCIVVSILMVCYTAQCWQEPNMLASAINRVCTFWHCCISLSLSTI